MMKKSNIFISIPEKNHKIQRERDTEEKGKRKDNDTEIKMKRSWLINVQN